MAKTEPTDDAQELQRYCFELRLELEANTWLQKELLARLANRKNHRDYNSAHTLVRGRLFRPALMHLYLLRHGPFPDGSLDAGIMARLCEETGSDPILARHYYEGYGGGRLPRPLIRNVLKQVVSNGSADSIITALTTLQLADAVPCDRGRNNIAIAFKRELFETIEKWIDMKTGKHRHGR